MKKLIELMMFDVQALERHAINNAKTIDHMVLVGYIKTLKNVVFDIKVLHEKITERGEHINDNFGL